MSILESLEELMDGNQVPTDEERKVLSQFLGKVDAKLSAVRETMGGLKEKLQTLEREEEALLEAAEPYKRALSPFRRLPEDMIREIFSACLDPGHNSTMSNKNAPMFLTQISSGLRQIAVTTPVLWTSIHIPIPRLSRTVLENGSKALAVKRAEGVREWLLKRSGSLPLNISVYDPARDYEIYDNDVPKEIIDILLSCCSRWKSVVFSGLPQSYFRVAALKESDTPLLQSLTLYLGRHPEIPPEIWAESGLLSGPSFERFALHGHAETFSRYAVNWANITHLTLQNTDIWEADEVPLTITDILRRTTRLVSCDISTSDIQLTGLSDIAEIPLPFLRILVISLTILSGVDRVHGVLSSMNAPLLEVFVYNLATEPGIRDFLQRSPNIRELGLGYASSYDIVAEYLRFCPLLTTLHLRGVSNSSSGDSEDDPSPGPENAFLELFCTDDENQCLCPRLQYILFEASLRISIETLRKFILRKKGNIAGWKGAIMFVHCDTATETLINKLKLEVEGVGVKFDVTCHTEYIADRLDEGMNSGDMYKASYRDWWPTAVSRPTYY